MRSAVSAEDSRHPDYVAALVGTELSRGNAFDVLTNGDQIFPAMLEAIDGARRRISFETYIFDTGEVATRFTEALERAARRGVAVNLVVDAVGASSMAKEHLERLRQAGCHVAQFNAPAWYSLEEVNYRTHRKILVVDGEIGVHRRRRRRRSLAGQRRLEGALARHAGARARAGGADDGGGVLRELPRGRRHGAARARSGAATRRRRRGGARRAQLAERRQQRSEAALPAGARRGEAQPSTSPRRTSSPTNRRSGRSRTPSGAA